MYCNECRKRIDEDDIGYLDDIPAVKYPLEDSHPAESSPPFCPHCGDWLVDVTTCHGCDEAFPSDELHRYAGQDYCIGCLAFRLIELHAEDFRYMITKMLMSHTGLEYDTCLSAVSDQIHEYHSIKDEE